MNSLWPIQSLVSRWLREESSTPDGKFPNLCRKPNGALIERRFKICHTCRVLDCETLLRCSLVRSVLQEGRTLTSMDHHAEAWGIETVGDLADAGENGAQPNN